MHRNTVLHKFFIYIWIWTWFYVTAGASHPLSYTHLNIPLRSLSVQAHCKMHILCFSDLTRYINTKFLVLLCQISTLVIPLCHTRNNCFRSILLCNELLSFVGISVWSAPVDSYCLFSIVLASSPSVPFHHTPEKSVNQFLSKHCICSCQISNWEYYKFSLACHWLLSLNRTTERRRRALMVLSFYRPEESYLFILVGVFSQPIIADS